jgi:glycogen debranching enzyme
MSYKKLYLLAYESLVNLATDEGINASSASERFGCIFGRDSAITILKILKFLKRNQNTVFVDREKLFSMCQRTLLTLVSLQGKKVNIESGEEPGKFIHEYRKCKYDHLTSGVHPWYLYPDKILRNYDSIDSTPLALIAIFRYWEATEDYDFLLQVLSSVKAGLNWLIKWADKDGDGLIEYEFPKKRKHGGLFVQSWTDSAESIKKVDGSMPVYPIAPVEAQGYGWLALTLWADFFKESGHNLFAKKLSSHARLMKKSFNEKFIFKSEGFDFCAQALDGNKNQIKTVTGNPLLLLWASNIKAGKTEAIIKDCYIEDLVSRSFLPDLFVEGAGIRTMSSLAETYNPGKDSYHNGSFWPKLNGMAHEGLIAWGFKKEAKRLKSSTLKPLLYFKSPIELYTKENNTLLEYCSKEGNQGCKIQAWTAAVALDLVDEIN